MRVLLFFIRNQKKKTESVTDSFSDWMRWHWNILSTSIVSVLLSCIGSRMYTIWSLLSPFNRMLNLFVNFYLFYSHLSLSFAALFLSLILFALTSQRSEGVHICVLCEYVSHAIVSFDHPQFCNDSFDNSNSVSKKKKKSVDKRKRKRAKIKQTVIISLEICVNRWQT